MLKICEDRAVEIINDEAVWSLISDVAKALQSKGVLEGAELNNLLTPAYIDERFMQVRPEQLEKYLEQ